MHSFGNSGKEGKRKAGRAMETASKIRFRGFDEEAIGEPKPGMLWLEMHRIERLRQYLAFI
jgi:hypothetical protein